METPETITVLMSRARAGDQGAQSELAEQLYEVLHSMAERQMSGQRGDHTLQATALVHEVWMKLWSGSVSFDDRAHFLAVASVAMRQVLVDHARARSRQKRDGGVRCSLDELTVLYEERAGDLLELEETLQRLASFEPQMARAVELRFFGGASSEECARILDIPRKQFERRWTLARAWLLAELGRHAS